MHFSVDCCLNPPQPNYSRPPSAFVQRKISCSFWKMFCILLCTSGSASQREFEPVVSTRPVLSGSDRDCLQHEDIEDLCSRQSDFFGCACVPRLSHHRAPFSFSWRPSNWPVSNKDSSLVCQSSHKGKWNFSSPKKTFHESSQPRPCFDSPNFRRNKLTGVERVAQFWYLSFRSTWFWVWSLELKGFELLQLKFEFKCCCQTKCWKPMYHSANCYRKSHTSWDRRLARYKNWQLQIEGRSPTLFEVRPLSLSPKWKVQRWTGAGHTLNCKCHRCRVSLKSTCLKMGSLFETVQKKWLCGKIFFQESTSTRILHWSRTRDPSIHHLKGFAFHAIPLSWDCQGSFVH